MDIQTIVLTLLIAANPSEPNAAARLAPVAEAIASESEAAPIFEGEDGPKKTALLLEAILLHESGARESVRTCKVRGDGGRSVGLYQAFRGTSWHGHTADEICASDRLQAHVALRTLHAQRSRGVTGHVALLRAYASGNAARDTKAARELANGYRLATRRAEALNEEIAIE